MTSELESSAMQLLERYLDVAASRQRAVATNMANLDTPGYTRKVPVLETEPAYFNGQVTVGAGVMLTGTESLRDRVLELRLSQQQTTQGGLDAYVDAMSPVELLFSGTGDVGSSMDQFFNSLTQLSSDPSNSALRQTVLSDAGTLAQSFQTTASNLASTQSSLDNNVVQVTEQINGLTAQIAALNPQVTKLQKLGADTGSFEDQRTELVQQLSKLTNVQIVNGDDGVTITTASGTPLVVGNQSYALTTARNLTSGLQHVYNGSDDVTADFTGGSLGGTLKARDQDLPSLMTSLDTLANNFANAINTAQSSGYDLNGNKGTNLFVAPTAVAGAALNLRVAITQPSQVAASSDTSTGGNGNLPNLLAVANAAISGGETPSQYYANVVFQAGNMVSQATAQQTASQAVLTQMQNQRDALSGVSLDEEATNLIQYQRAFQAAARVVNTIDECLQTALQMGVTP